jgi:hypothetical protein
VRGSPPDFPSRAAHCFSLHLHFSVACIDEDLIPRRDHARMHLQSGFTWTRSTKFPTPRYLLDIASLSSNRLYRRAHTCRSGWAEAVHAAATNVPISLGCGRGFGRRIPLCMESLFKVTSKCLILASCNWRLMYHRVEHVMRDTSCQNLLCQKVPSLVNQQRCMTTPTHLPGRLHATLLLPAQRGQRLLESVSNLTLHGGVSSISSF